MALDHKIPVATVLDAAKKVFSRYSNYWQERQNERLYQFSEEISLVYKPNGVIIDLGGGDGMRAAICCELGMQAYNVDVYELNADANDHMPAGFLQEFRAATEVAKSIGVQFYLNDVISWRSELENIDVVMSFDALEHLHHSPRTLFRHLTERIVPGGHLFIGAPNAANVLKRLRVLIGQNAFSKMADWYYTPYFTGHVREPIVADFKEIAKDLGMEATIIGANWLGREKFKQHHSLVSMADQILRQFPTLCSDIYMLAQKH